MRVVVIGAGAVGLGAGYKLQQMGAEVVLLEAEAAPAQVRSVGAGRIFRLSHETREMIEKARQAMQEWRTWEKAANCQLLRPTGLTMLEGWQEQNYTKAAKEANLEYEIALPRLQAIRDVSKPAYIEESGAAIKTLEMIDWLKKDLTIKTEQTVLQVIQEADRVRIVTEREEWEADKVLIAAGLKTAKLASQVGIKNLASKSYTTYRFLYAKREPGNYECMIDFRLPDTYGVDVDDEVYAIGLDWDNTSAFLEEEAIEYMKSHIKVWPGLKPEPLDVIECKPLLGLSDQPWQLKKQGDVTVLHGENYFKFIPLIALQAAEKTLETSK